MSQFYAGQGVSTCTGDPYAQAQTSRRRAASEDPYYLLYEIQSGQQGDDDTYGRLKEFQQRKTSA